MFSEKYKIKKIRIANLFFYLFVFIAIYNLVSLIKFELNHFYVRSFKFHMLSVEKPDENKQVDYNQANFQEDLSFLDLKNCSDMGWFNLNNNSLDYEKGLDINYVCFQYLVIPIILDKYGYNKKLICYYTSPEQLFNFCKKKEKYKLIKKDIFQHFALLEREE